MESGGGGPQEPSTGDFPTGDYPTGDYPTRDYPDLAPEERERRRIPRDRRPPPHGRRHRDLPARVRRRQAIAVLVVAIVVIGGALLLFSGGGGGSSSQQKGQISVRKLVGQTMIGKMPRSGPTKDLLKRVRKGELGGVVVGAKSESDLKRFDTRLANAAKAGHNPPLLLMIDQEGGPVQRVPGPPTISPAQLGKTGDANASKAQGLATGTFLKKAGVNVDLAPVADVIHTSTPATLKTRMFGTDPAKVGELAKAFAQGLEEGGVAATVKHFPGLGYVDANPDFAVATVGAAPAQVQADLVPFSDAIKAGAPLVMLSTAIYNNSFHSPAPAPGSPQIIRDELRTKLGFKGVAITDDLEGVSATNTVSLSQAGTLSLKAGVDMVLFAKTVGASKSAYKSLVNSAKAGKLARDVLTTAYGRIIALKSKYASG